MTQATYDKLAEVMANGHTGIMYVKGNCLPLSGYVYQDSFYTGQGVVHELNDTVELSDPEKVTSFFWDCFGTMLDDDSDTRSGTRKMDEAKANTAHKFKLDARVVTWTLNRAPTKQVTK